MENQTIIKVSDLFKLLSDVTRLKILWHLKEGPLNVSEIAEVVGLSLSAVSHQLKTLRMANLVKKEKQGREVYYEYDDHHVYGIFTQAIEHVQED